LIFYFSISAFKLFNINFWLFLKQLSLIFSGKNFELQSYHLYLEFIC